jgi:hypothetical protein
MLGENRMSGCGSLRALPRPRAHPSRNKWPQQPSEDFRSPLGTAAGPAGDAGGSAECPPSLSRWRPDGHRKRTRRRRMRMPRPAGNGLYPIPPLLSVADAFDGRRTGHPSGAWQDGQG